LPGCECLAVGQLEPEGQYGKSHSCHGSAASGRRRLFEAVPWGLAAEGSGYLAPASCRTDRCGDILDRFRAGQRLIRNRSYRAVVDHPNDARRVCCSRASAKEAGNGPYRTMHTLDRFACFRAADGTSRCDNERDGNSAFKPSHRVHQTRGQSYVIALMPC